MEAVGPIPDIHTRVPSANRETRTVVSSVPGDLDVRISRCVYIILIILISRFWQASTPAVTLVPIAERMPFHRRTDAGLRVKRLKEPSSSLQTITVGGNHRCLVWVPKIEP